MIEQLIAGVRDMFTIVGVATMLYLWYKAFSAWWSGRKSPNTP